MIIYKTTNLINGKIYVGQDSNNREEYLGSGKIFNLAVKKYGRQNFKKETLEHCDTIEELNEREIYWIKETNARNKEIGYNILTGGSNVLRKGQTLKEIYGEERAEEIRNSLSDSHKNIIQSKEQIQKRTESTKKSKEGKVYPCSGEQKKKISEKNKNRVFTLEQKDNCRIGHLSKTERGRAVLLLPKPLEGNSRYIYKLFYSKNKNEVYLCLTNDFGSALARLFENKSCNPVNLWVKQNNNNLPSLEVIDIVQINSIKERESIKKLYREKLKTQGFNVLNRK